MRNAVTAVMQTRRYQYTLGALLAFLALNALGGGYYAITGAKGVPVEWLQDSPFSSYFVPGLVLFFVVGGTSATAAVAVLARNQQGADLAKIAGWVLAAWLIGQVAIIGFVSWLQPTTALAAVAILLLAYRREHAPAAPHYMRG